MKLIRCTLVALACLTPLADSWAVTEDPADIHPVPDETIDQFKSRLMGMQKKGETGVSAVENAAKADAPVAAREASARIAAKTTTASAPEGFADRVNNSIADYLPFFQGAINAVSTSEDKKSLTLKLNPLRVGTHGNISTSLTAAEAQVFQPLLDEVVEPARGAQSDAILKTISDFSDLTWSFSYGYQQPAPRNGWRNKKGARWMWGRNWDLYKPLTDEMLTGALSSMGTERTLALAAANTLSQPFEDDIWTHCQTEPECDPNVPGASLGNLTFKRVQALIPDFDLAGYEKALKGTAVALNSIADYVASWKFSEKLPALVDNQPQLVFAGSYRSTNDLVGPDSYALSLSFEWGLVNFNSVISEFRQLRDDPPEGLESLTPDKLTPLLVSRAYSNVALRNRVLNEDKIVFSATYKSQDPYDVSYDYEETVTDPNTGAQSMFSRTADLSLPRAHEFIGRVSWTRFIVGGKKLESEGAESVEKAAHPRLELSMEYVDVSDDPSRQDRWIGRLTYTLPVPGGVSIPVTLTYSNHSEFLGEQDKVFSAHLGLTYKKSRDQ